MYSLDSLQQDLRVQVKQQRLQSGSSYMNIPGQNMLGNVGWVQLF